VGSLRWMDELGVGLGALADRAQQPAKRWRHGVGRGRAHHAQGLALRAMMAFGDEPKPGAREALAALRARGIRTVMISGDNRGAAEAMARAWGWTRRGRVMAEVLPGDKAAKVQRATAEISAAGLPQGAKGGQRPSAAACGRHGGRRRERRPGPGRGRRGHGHGQRHRCGHARGRHHADARRPDAGGCALDISHRTVSKIRQNLFWAFAYNVAGIPLAALGYLNPVVAGRGHGAQFGERDGQRPAAQALAPGRRLPHGR
jgi:Cu+-exporting ATPase